MTSRRKLYERRRGPADPAPLSKAVADATYQPGLTPGAAVADATDATTVITQLNTLLARLRALGLIAT